jgi:4-hydroxy-2-oxoglutarate aldolase
MRISGVFPPIATPFDAQERLHVDALAANIRRWDEAGVSGYLVSGSNGESALLEFAEIVQALRVVRQAAAPGKVLLAGTGCQSTQATVRLTCAAAEAGADAAVVLPSFYFGSQMTEQALLRHYEAVANASPIPILVYNMPNLTHLNIAPETVARLAGHANIIGMKDSAGNIGQVIDLLRLCPPDFDILIGNAPAFLSGLQVGASGGILALANVAPRECVALYNAFRVGQMEQARALQFRLMSVGKAVTTGYGVPGLKAALDMVGYYGGSPRLPLLPVSDTARNAIRQILVEAGLMG